MRKKFGKEKIRKGWKKALCALLCSATVFAGCGDADKEGAPENATPTQGTSQGESQGNDTQGGSGADDVTPTQGESQENNAQSGNGKDDTAPAQDDSQENNTQGSMEGDGSSQTVAMRDMTTMRRAHTRR